MTIKAAVLGCGMMGQEHISYMTKYNDIEIKFLCDPYPPSINKALAIIAKSGTINLPIVYKNEMHMLKNHVSHPIKKENDIDLLVIATPNYMHTPQLLRWGQYPITILVEKPVAINERQIMDLRTASTNTHFRANVWVAMEYRYIPAIQKLIQLLPQIGPVKCITIRENRYPFLSKINEWNKDITKSGDTLVEKCCHFFDLFRLLSQSEMHTCTTKIQRGLLSHHYGYYGSDDDDDDRIPIIDSAYVLLDFHKDNEIATTAINVGYHDGDDAKEEKESSNQNMQFLHEQATMGCLELCMFAEGSRHQEEIICTGMNGRLEAYLPENKVFYYKRPTGKDWPIRSEPPPPSSIKEQIFDCSDLSCVYPSFGKDIPHHSGYHYCSTAVEWKFLIDQIKSFQSGGTFNPQVSLADGIAAVEMGIVATHNIAKNCFVEKAPAHTLGLGGYPSTDHLIDLAFRLSID